LLRLRPRTEALSGPDEGRQAVQGHAGANRAQPGRGEASWLLPTRRGTCADLVNHGQRCDLDNLVCPGALERKQVSMKTKGALIWEFNQPWSIEEIEIGDPVKDEVKIQMEASGMCHSDHHLVTGDIPMAGFPVLGGHEGAGIVTEVGPGVEDISPGDHVVLSFIPSCGACPSCQA